MAAKDKEQRPSTPTATPVAPGFVLWEPCKNPVASRQVSDTTTTTTSGIPGHDPGLTSAIRQDLETPATFGSLSVNGGSFSAIRQDHDAPVTFQSHSVNAGCRQTCRGSLTVGSIMRDRGSTVASSRTVNVGSISTSMSFADRQDRDFVDMSTSFCSPSDPESSCTSKQDCDPTAAPDSLSVNIGSNSTSKQDCDPAAAPDSQSVNVGSDSTSRQDCDPTAAPDSQSVNVGYDSTSRQDATNTSNNSSPNPGPTSPFSSSSSSPVLVLLFTWLFCKPASAAKYASLYTSRGIPVLQISSSLSHFVWPPNSKTFADQIRRVLEGRFSGYGRFLVHAMSIGAYNLTTCRQDGSVEMRDCFLDKVVGVVYDSLTLGSLDHMVQGIVTGLSPWSVVRSAATSLANLYFLATRKTTVDAFNQGVEFFKASPAHVPTLVFACRNDPMCDARVLEEMVRDWRTKGLFPVTAQVWDKSAHCGHLIHHPQVYKQSLQQFVGGLKLNALGGGGEEPLKVISKL